MGKIEEHEEKRYMMVDNYMLNKALDKTKNIIGIQKFDDTKILVNTDYKLPVDITLKNVAILVTSVNIMINIIHKYF